MKQDKCICVCVTNWKPEGGEGGTCYFCKCESEALATHNAFMPRILHSIHTQTFLTFVLWLDTVFAFHAVYSAFSLEDQRSVGWLEQQNIPPTRLGGL